jgi:hypothetical protein
LFSQRFPGLAKHGTGDDSKACRLIWFEQCLELLGADIRQLNENLQDHHTRGFFKARGGGGGGGGSGGGVSGGGGGGGGGGGDTISVAMPYLIGCGLAGGDWPTYHRVIEQWAEKYQLKVKLYDRDRQSAK